MSPHPPHEAHRTGHQHQLHQEAEEGARVVSTARVCQTGGARRPQGVPQPEARRADILLADVGFACTWFMAEHKREKSKRQRRPQFNRTRRRPHHPRRQRRQEQVPTTRRRTTLGGTNYTAFYSQQRLHSVLRSAGHVNAVFFYLLVVFGSEFHKFRRTGN